VVGEFADVDLARGLVVAVFDGGPDRGLLLGREPHFVPARSRPTAAPDALAVLSSSVRAASPTAARSASKNSPTSPSPE